MLCQVLTLVLQAAYYPLTGTSVAVLSVSGLSEVLVAPGLSLVWLFRLVGTSVRYFPVRATGLTRLSARLTSSVRVQAMAPHAPSAGDLRYFSGTSRRKFCERHWDAALAACLLLPLFSLP